MVIQIHEKDFINKAPVYMDGKVKSLYEEAVKNLNISMSASFLLLMNCVELLCVNNGCVGKHLVTKFKRLLDRLGFSYDTEELEFINKLSEQFELPVYEINLSEITCDVMDLFATLHSLGESYFDYQGRFKSIVNSTSCIICNDPEGLKAKPHRIFGYKKNGKLEQECTKCGVYQYDELDRQEILNKDIVERTAMLNSRFSLLLYSGKNLV